MKNFLALFLFSLVLISACKDTNDDPCAFRNSGELIDPEYHMDCDTCYFSYFLQEHKVHFPSTTIGEGEELTCMKSLDSCSHVVDYLRSPQSFVFLMQRTENEDSLAFVESVGKVLPLRLPDSIYWGKKMLSASLELIDKCENSYFATGIMTIDNIEYLSSRLDDDVDVHMYHIAGFINADISVKNENEHICGRFSFNKDMLIFHQDNQPKTIPSVPEQINKKGLQF